MDIKNLPENPIERRTKILQERIDEVIDASLLFINREYEQKKFLIKCNNFVEKDIVETSKSDFESQFKRIGFFPATEASIELGEAFNRSIEGAYKSVYDHLRRALELTLIGAYFTSTSISAQLAQKWLSSEKETPFFKRVRKTLLQNDRFIGLEKACAWSLKLRHLFWSLSDIIHVRGSKFSFQSFHPAIGSISGTTILGFSENSLRNALDTYILTIRHMSTIIAASNPILLVGLPIEQKFGIYPPISGFFVSEQSEELWELLLPDSIEYFGDLVKTDSEVTGLKAWFKSIPDISEVELERQVDDLKRCINQFKINK